MKFLPDGGADLPLPSADIDTLNETSSPTLQSQAQSSPLPGSSLNGDTFPFLTTYQKRKAMREKNRRNGILAEILTSERKRRKTDDQGVKVVPDYVVPDCEDMLAPELPEIRDVLLPIDPIDGKEIDSDTCLTGKRNDNNETAPVLHITFNTTIKLEPVDEPVRSAILDSVLHDPTTFNTTSIGPQERDIAPTPVIIAQEDATKNDLVEVQLTNGLTHSVLVIDLEDESIEPSPSPLSMPLGSPTVCIKAERLEIEVIDLTRQDSTLTETPAVPFKPHPLDRLSKRECEDITAGRVEVPGVLAMFLNLSESPPLCLPPKTNYLNAGLFSNVFKRSSSSLNLDSTLPIGQLEALLKVPLTKQTICPPVADTGGKRGGSTLMPESNYQLPFDIYSFGVAQSNNNFEQWAQSEEARRTEARRVKKLEKRRDRRRTLGAASPALSDGKLMIPPAPSPQTWTYRRLRINSYIGATRQPSCSKKDDQTCECKPSRVKCGNEDCLNRVVFTECPESCGELCRNRRIQKHEWALGLKRFLTKNKGYGIKTKVGLKKGDFILEYVGEVVSETEFRRRMLDLYANDTHHYCLQLGSGLVIDGHRTGHIGRFVNHSCEPNCEMQKWSVNGVHRMALFALENVLPGEELCYDYNFSLYNETEGQPCYCLSTNCRGVIGGKVKDVKATDRHRPKNRSQLPGVLSTGLLVCRKRLPKPHSKLGQLRRVGFIRNSNLFLVRNYEQVRNVKRRPENKIQIEPTLVQNRKGKTNEKKKIGKHKSTSPSTSPQGKLQPKEIIKMRAKQTEQLEKVVTRIKEDIRNYHVNPIDLSHLLRQVRQARKSKPWMNQGFKQLCSRSPPRRTSPQKVN